MHSWGSILCLCVCVCVRVKGRRLVIVAVHLSAMLSPTVCDSSREPEPKERPTGIKKALSTGCVSQWAAEPRGAALLIKARAVCQWRHMMHGAINVGVKTKREAKLLQQICCFTMEARHLTTTMTVVASSVSIGLFCYLTINLSMSLQNRSTVLITVKQRKKMGFATKKISSNCFLKGASP